MKLLVVSLLNAYIGAYDQPTFVPYVENDDLIEGYRRSVMANPDAAFRAQAHEKVLCILAKFDDSTGQFELFGGPQKVKDLASLFPAGFLAKKLAVDKPGGEEDA